MEEKNQNATWKNFKYQAQTESGLQLYGVPAQRTKTTTSDPSQAPNPIKKSWKDLNQTYPCPRKCKFMVKQIEVSDCVESSEHFVLHHIIHLFLHVLQSGCSRVYLVQESIWNRHGTYIVNTCNKEFFCFFLFFPTLGPMVGNPIYFSNISYNEYIM